MNMDTTYFTKQLRTTINLDPGQVKIKIITLQKELYLIANHAAPNFQYTGIHTAASQFG